MIPLARARRGACGLLKIEEPGEVLHALQLGRTEQRLADGEDVVLRKADGPFIKASVSCAPGKGKAIPEA